MKQIELTEQQKEKMVQVYQSTLSVVQTASILGIGKNKTRKILKELKTLNKIGKYLRRPHDFKNAEFTKIRNRVFNRDNYTCQITGIKGGHLHAHHLIPYWVCPKAFYDMENIITVTTEVHISICHKGDWAKFNPDLVSDKLLYKYSLNRERLNELADFYNKSDAIVLSSDI